MRLKAALTAMVLSIVLIAALAISCFGQRTMATLGGVVEDETHAVLPGVQVRLLNEGTSAVLEQLTNERGEFLFDFVPVGTYTLKLEMAGFKNLESRNISLGAAQKLRRTYTLQIGGPTARSNSTTGAAPGNNLAPPQRPWAKPPQSHPPPTIKRTV